MFKERKYRIKSINYNVDTYPDDIDKISISSANYQNKNSLSNKDNNFINPSIEVKKIISSDQKQYNALKSLQENKDKYNSFSDEVELSFEKNIFSFTQHLKNHKWVDRTNNKEYYVTSEVLSSNELVKIAESMSVAQIEK